MTSFLFTTTSIPTSAATCDVDQTYFPHLFLAPAGIIITVLAFLRKRKSFKKDIWGGRPGIVVPIDFLGMDHDRLAIMCVFGAATGSIFNLILNGAEGSNAWETAFLSIGTALEVAFLYYPYFGCLASYHRIIGALMGLPYGVIYLSISLMADLQKCNKITTWEEYVLKILPNMPTILCHLFILGKFILVLYKEIKEHGIFGMQLFSHNVDEHASRQVKLIRPWLRDHVHDLIKSRPARHYSGVEFYLRKIYNPEKNFTFSTITVSVVMICSILLYNISFKLVFVAGYGLDQFRKVSDRLRKNHIHDLREIWAKVYLGFFASLMAATILAFIFCVASFIRFMENHKNNMLRMFKGDKSFIPKNISTSQFMIGKGLRYHGYQIGYFLWGYLLLLSLLSVISFALYLLSFKPVRDMVVNYMKGGSVYMSVAIFSGLSLPIISLTVFRDYRYSKNVISINNRNAYMVFSYFWFFVGLPMGFVSAISRILKAMAVGALMLPRIDHSVMPDGFQQIDRGFNAYICYLHVETAYRNPVLRVFCQILIDETQNNPRNVQTLGINKVRKWTFSAQARARWFLALTLARNPQLASDRKPNVQAPQPAQAGHARHGDVVIEIDQFCADNTALIQDK